MAPSTDWREFLELLNSHAVDYLIVGTHRAAHFMGARAQALAEDNNRVG
jgi:hypothetical protein